MINLTLQQNVLSTEYANSNLALAVNLSHLSQQFWDFITRNICAVTTSSLIQFARFMARNRARKSSHVIKNSSERKSSGHNKSCIHDPSLFFHSFLWFSLKFVPKIKLRFLWCMRKSHSVLSSYFMSLKSNKNGYKIIKSYPDLIPYFTDSVVKLINPWICELWCRKILCQYVTNCMKLMG